MRHLTGFRIRIASDGQLPLLDLLRGTPGRGPEPGRVQVRPSAGRPLPHPPEDGFRGSAA